MAACRLPSGWPATGAALAWSFLAAGSAREAVHVSGQDTNPGFAEKLLVGGHGAAPAVADRLDDRRFAGAMQPGLVGQVGCAEHRVAFSFGAMAGGAGGLERLLATRRADRIMRAAGERQDIVSRVPGPFVAERRAESGHRAVASVEDALLDELRLSAIKPVAVGEIRKAFTAARIGRMALRAVVQEQFLSDGASLRVACELTDVLVGEARV